MEPRSGPRRTSRSRTRGAHGPDAAAELRGDGAASTCRALERPPKPDFGDYSTNAAMLLAPALGEPPRAIAERLGETLGDRLGGAVERVEVAGPGFLNLFMADAWYVEALAAALAAGDRYGAGAPERRRAGAGGVRERQPDRAAHGRLRPPRRLRRLALPRCSSSPATRSSASTT